MPTLADKMNGEDGFTLLEFLIALGLSLGMLALAMQQAAVLQRCLAATAAQTEAEAEIDRLETLFRRDAASAAAISASGRSLRFTAIDMTGGYHAWQYDFSPVQGLSITRNGVQNVLSTHVDAFDGIFLAADQLASRQNGDAAVLQGLPMVATYPMRLGPVTVQNGVAVVTFGIGSVRRSVHLIAGTSPSGFGVETGTFWHAVIWREAHTRRFFFGFGQKSWFDIFGEVTYTYDHWTTSHLWCIHEIYNGLDVSDPRGSITYTDQHETAAAIFQDCQKDLHSSAPPSPASVGG